MTGSGPQQPTYGAAYCSTARGMNGLRAAAFFFMGALLGAIAGYIYGLGVGADAMLR